MQDTQQGMSTRWQRQLAVPSVQFPAASSVMNPEMLIWPMTAQNKDYFQFLFAARDQVITFGLISLRDVY